MAGFFSNTHQINAAWNVLDSMDRLNAALEESHRETVVLFKHSTRCIISSSAKRRLESDYHQVEDDVSFYYLDLLMHRDLSNEIAQRLSVVHQSPQIIVVKQGKAVMDTSHEGVSVEAIRSSI